VCDDELIESVPPEAFHLVLRYILGADIDKEAFEMRLQLISDPEIRTTAMTLAQRYHQEGRQEGRQEGILKGRREDVLEALSIRFDHVPEGLREAVLAVADEDTLRELHRAAIRCESLEAFAKTL
jgi:hypothetical protein